MAGLVKKLVGVQDCPSCGGSKWNRMQVAEDAFCNDYWHTYSELDAIKEENASLRKANAKMQKLIKGRQP